MPFKQEPGRLWFENGAGERALDSNKTTMHGVRYKQGSVVLPRVSNAPLGQATPAPVINTDIDLGPVLGSEAVFGGMWRIADAESLALGEIREIQYEQVGTRRYRRRHLYAPRKRPEDWFMIGGINKVDSFRFLYSVNPFTIQTSGSNIPEVGMLTHTIQFVIDNGRYKLIRRGSGIAYNYTYLTIGGFPTADTYEFAFDCAALTIDYRIWLGAFT